MPALFHEILKQIQNGPIVGLARTHERTHGLCSRKKMTEQQTKYESYAIMNPVRENLT